MNATQSVQVDLAGLVTKIEQIAESSNNSFQGLRAVHDLLLAVRDLMLRGITDEVIRTHPNPLNRHGRQCFSPSDEDGLTLEIVRAWASRRESSPSSVSAGLHQRAHRGQRVLLAGRGCSPVRGRAIRY